MTDNFKKMEEGVYKKIYKGKTIIIKVSGAEISNKVVFHKFVLKLKKLISYGIKVVLVFGGGEQIDTCYDKVRIKKDGVGVTTKDVLDNGVIPAYREILKTLENEFANYLESDIPNPEKLLCKKEGVEYGYVGKPVDVLLNPNKKLNIVGFLGVCKKNKATFLNVNADDIVYAITKQNKISEIIFATSTGGVLDVEGNLVKSIRKKNLIKILDGESTSVKAEGGMYKKLSQVYKLLHHTDKVSITKITNVYKELMEFEGSGTLCFNFYNHEFKKIKNKELFEVINRNYTNKKLWKKRSKKEFEEIFKNHYIFSVGESVFGGYTLKKDTLPKEINVNNGVGYSLEAYWSMNEKNGVGSEILKNIIKRSQAVGLVVFCYTKLNNLDKYGFVRGAEKSKSGATLWYRLP